MLDTADTGGVVIPLVVIAFCLLIIVISAGVRRRKRRRAGDTDPGDTGSANLAGWQRSHGHDVDRWLDAHESTLGDLVPGADPAIAAGLDRAMADAAAECPDPDLAADLTTMRESGAATRAGLVSCDRTAAEAAHDEYGRHRAAAITRMTATDTGAAAGVGAATTTHTP